jgi:hypothetical protein
MDAMNVDGRSPFLIAFSDSESDSEGEAYEEALLAAWEAAANHARETALPEPFRTSQK